VSKALITGVAGQVGSFMADYLLDGGYEVHGLDRRKAVPNYCNIEHIKDRIQLIEGDITDAHCMNHIIQAGQYDEIYGLAAMSHVGTSFNEPASTMEIDAIGILNLLEAIKNYSKHSRFYFAGTSELFGKSLPPQNEATPLAPQSPYGCAKLAAHHMVRIYSQAYGLKATGGFMFNTESPRRGDTFVTKKITNWGREWLKMVAAPEPYKIQPLVLGNMYAKRDWSHALDAVDAIYRIIHQDTRNKNWDGVWKPYCFGSGVATSVKDFLQIILTIIEESCMSLYPNEPALKFSFTGEGVDEKVITNVSNVPVVTISKEFYRPAEVDYLLCDPTKIKTELGWEPKYNLQALVKDMLGVK
jgi:GDPmannose 4,6-dehydratase